MSEPQGNLVAGIDLGGTNTQIGIVNEAGRIVARLGLKTLADQGSDAVLGRLCDGVKQACGQAGCAPGELAGIGVGVPSPIDSTGRIALHAVNLKWKNLPVAQQMEQRLSGCPVVLDNDVNVAVWGEFVHGAARGYHDVLGLWIGTGIGGGLVLGGQLHHGTFGTAGEIGMATVYLKATGEAMRFEDFAARSAIEQRLARARGGQRLSLGEIASAVESGDAVVREVIESAADLTGLMAANAATLLSLDAIVLGGGLVEVLGASYTALVRKRFDEVVFPEDLKACAIVETALRENAGLLGAASLARTRLSLNRAP